MNARRARRRRVGVVGHESTVAERLVGAERGEVAVVAVLARPRGELLVADRPPPPSAAARRAGGRRRRARGPAAGPWPPEVAAGAGRARRPRPVPVRPAQVVDRSVLDRELVEPELRVLRHRLAGRRLLGGLEVHDDDPAVLVDLEPVGVAVQPDDLAVAPSPPRGSAARCASDPRAPGRRCQSRNQRSAPRPPARSVRRDQGVRNGSWPHDLVDVRHQLARRRSSSSPLADPVGEACTTLPNPWLASLPPRRRPPARGTTWRGRSSSPSRALARDVTGSSVGPHRARRTATRRAGPHQVAGSAAGTSGRPRRRRRRAGRAGVQRRRAAPGWSGSAAVRRSSATSPASDSGRTGRPDAVYRLDAELAR